MFHAFFLFQKAVGIDKYLLNNAPYLHFELCPILLYNVHFFTFCVFSRFLLKLLSFIYLTVLGLSCGHRIFDPCCMPYL